MSKEFDGLPPHIAMNPIRRKSGMDGASISKKTLVSGRRRSFKEMVTLFGYAAVFMNAIVATTAGVVDCRCEYPNENHYDHVDWTRRNDTSFKNERREYVVVDGQRLIPWDHAACRGVEFVCPEDDVGGTSWDHVCVQKDFRRRRGGMRWNKTNKYSVGKTGSTALTVVKENTSFRDKNVGMAMGGKKSKSTTRGKNGSLETNIFNRANRRAMQMKERKLKSKTRKTQLRQRKIVVVVLPPDNPLCTDETPGPTGAPAIDGSVSASLSGRSRSDAFTSLVSTRLFSASSTSASPPLPPTTVPSGVPSIILSAEPTSNTQAITGAPSPSLQPTIEALAIIAAHDAARNSVSSESPSTSSVVFTDNPSYAATELPNFTPTWIAASDSMAPSESTAPTAIPTFTSTSAVPSTSIAPSAVSNANASITPNVSSNPRSAPSTIASSSNPTATPSSTPSVLSASSRAPSAAPAVSSPSEFLGIETIARPSGNIRGPPVLSPTLSPSNSGDANSSVAPTNNPSNAESEVPTFTSTLAVATDSIAPSASVVETEFPTFTWMWAFPSDSMAPSESTAPTAIPTLTSASAVPSTSIAPSAVSNANASFTPSVSSKPSSAPSTIASSSNLPATPSSTSSALSTSSHVPSAAPTVSSPNGFLSVEALANSGGNISAVPSLTPSAPPTSPPSPSPSPIAASIEPSIETSIETSFSPSRAVDNSKNLLS